jgi:hypothetical protein
MSPKPPDPIPPESYSPFGSLRDPFETVTADTLARDIAALIPSMKASDGPGTRVPGFKLQSLADVLARPDVPPDYLVDGLLVRGTVGMIAAKPKVGKSTLARVLCLAVARGRDFLGRRTNQGSCIYLALEEREQELRADFRAMGATGKDPIHIHADSVPAEGMLALVDLVRSLRPALIVIDPLFRLARVRDEKAYAEVCTALTPLIDVSRETGTHILIVHHSGKSAKGDAIDSPLGSTALSAAVSTLIVLKRTDNYRSVQTVQRIGTDMPETILAFDVDTRELSIGGTRSDVDRDSLAQEIVDYLRSLEGEKTEPEICDAVEGTQALKRRALRSLVERRQVRRDGSGTRGNPFRYSYSRTEYIARTSVQETQKPLETSIIIDEKLVRKSETAGLFDEVRI